MDTFTEEGAELVWHDNVSSFYWGVNLTQFYIDDEPFYVKEEKKESTSWLDDIAEQAAIHSAILDSGNSFINLPGDVFDKIMGMINERAGECFYNEYGNLLCPCEATKPETWSQIYPTLKATFDDITYQIPTASWIMPAATNLCSVEIHKMDSIYFDLYIFGLTFLENYYSVHDMVNNRVGLAPSNYNKLK